VPTSEALVRVFSADIRNGFQYSWHPCVNACEQVFADNVQFLRDQAVYSAEFFAFIKALFAGIEVSSSFSLDALYTCHMCGCRVGFAVVMTWLLWVVSRLSLDVFCLLGQPMVLGEGASALPSDLAHTVIQAGVSFLIDVLARADVRARVCWVATCVFPHGWVLFRMLHKCTMYSLRTR
jgi:hypothetical protein